MQREIPALERGELQRPGPGQVQGPEAPPSGLPGSSPPQAAEAGWLRAYRRRSRAAAGRGIGVREAKGPEREHRPDPVPPKHPCTQEAGA